MSLSSAISRVSTYYRRYGCLALIRHSALALNRAIFQNYEFVFYCDLPEDIPFQELPKALEVEPKKSEEELGPEDMREMLDFWNPKLARREIKNRFERGAVLWIAKYAGNLVGFCWTLRGQTMEPHYFRLGPDDVHFFDAFVFPQFRGLQAAPVWVMPILILHMLHNLADAACRGRVFCEAAEWNQAMLVCLKMTPFRRLGLARRFTIFHRTIVCWVGKESSQQERKDKIKKESLVAMG